MGNGDEIKGSGLCRGLRLQLADLTIVAYFFPSKLGESDVVLGFQWLATVGDSVMNWGSYIFWHGAGMDKHYPGFLK